MTFLNFFSMTHLKDRSRNHRKEAGWVPFWLSYFKFIIQHLNLQWFSGLNIVERSYYIIINWFFKFLLSYKQNKVSFQGIDWKRIKLLRVTLIIFVLCLIWNLPRTNELLMYFCFFNSSHLPLDVDRLLININLDKSDSVQIYYSKSS